MEDIVVCVAEDSIDKNELKNILDNILQSKK